MKKLALATLIAGSVMATGCSTINPYTGEKQTSKAATGAAIGAGVGALIGVATGDNAKERRERALAGAGIGAITGGGVGVYMDTQEAKLRQELEATGVSVTRDGDNIILNMPGNITFASNATVVNESFKPVLQSVAKVLKEFEKTMIQVGGHTDSDGSDQYNLQLSQNRAQGVSNVLLGFGVQSVRIATVGFGETQPIASNSTAAGKAQNRRVELVLLPYSQ